MMPVTTTEPTHEEFQLSRPHLLIVDDDHDTAMLLQRICQPSYDVTCVGSGQEALHLLGEMRFDLALLDIMMEDVTGLDVLRSIRSSPDIAEMPVVLVSALSHSVDIVEGLGAGANDYITKPFDIDVVRARIQCQIDLKRRRDEREQTLQRDNLALRERFLQIATHDLKNPLNNIRLAHFYLKSLLGDNPAAIEALDTIESTTNTMSELVEHFLDSAALQSGRAEIQPGAVVLEDALWEVISRHSASANRKNITLLLHKTEGVALVDPHRLAQIIGNLVSNAIKYSPLDRVVTVSSEVSGQKVRISVMDEGLGIPPQEREQLFQPFTRLTPRPTDGESSTGLGLWIVKELTELQNGTVGCEFPAEGGSVFWVELPVYAEPAN